MDKSADAITHARLLAVASSELGAWLTTLSVPSLGLHMEDDVVWVATGLRPGVHLCIPHVNIVMSRWISVAFMA